MKSNWPTKKLGEVCEIMSPGIKEFEGSKKYVATADVDFDKIVNFTEITYKNRPSRANIEVRENDILVARMAETKKFLIADKNLQDNYIFSTGFAVMRVKEELTPRYLFYFLTTKDFNLQKDKLAVGATQKAINNPALKKIKIPLPPLPIQQKIVERIEELFEKIDKAKELRQKAQEETETIFPSALQEIFDKAEKKWGTKKLGEIIELHYGKGIPQKDRKVDGKYPIYGANGELGRTDKYFVEGEAIIIGRKGTAGAVNRVSGRFWPADVTYYVFGNEKIDIDFLFYTFKKIDLSQLATGIKPGINRNKVYELQIPLPPLSEQKKIVDYLDSLREKVGKLKQLQQKQLEELNELKNSILDKAFKGELVG